VELVTKPTADRTSPVRRHQRFFQPGILMAGGDSSGTMVVDSIRFGSTLSVVTEVASSLEVFNCDDPPL